MNPNPPDIELLDPAGDFEKLEIAIHYGADAVYAAVARRHDATLVTRDREQLDRVPPTVPTVSPEDALSQLDEAPSIE